MALSVEVPPGMEEEMNEELERGRYKSKSELMRDAIRRLLEENKKIDNHQLSKEAQKQIDRARQEDSLTPHEDVKENLG